MISGTAKTSDPPPEAGPNSRFQECQKKRKNTRHELTILLLIVALALVIPLLIITATHPAGAVLTLANNSATGATISSLPHSVTIWWVAAWMAMVLLILAFICKLGEYNLCRPMGIFVNEQNVMSLSRMQIVAWTLVIVSALFVMVCVRLIYGEPDPFGVIIDWHVWAVLGLSASAAVGAPLINSGKSAKDPAPTDQQTVDRANRAASDAAVEAKKREQEATHARSNRTPDAEDLETGAAAAQENARKKQEAAENLVRFSGPVNRTARLLNRNPEEVEKNRDGLLFGNPDPSAARFTDIFEGDELATAMYIDISKVQMFWFSVVAIGGYAILVLGMLYANNPVNLDSFPAFSDGFIAILTVSHAAYLGGKGITKTRSEDN
jgi:hypothetical protein